jgi:hypothetical protein
MNYFHSWIQEKLLLSQVKKEFQDNNRFIAGRLP